MRTVSYLPAGRYYVGDLCYVMSSEWDEVCKLTIKGAECLSGQFQLSDGRKFAMFTTKWGDGLYKAGSSEFCVDSGSIGCIKVSDITNPDEVDMRRLGGIFDFDESFVVYSDDGIIRFGYMLINTDPDEFYDDEEEETDYEDA